MGADTGDQEDKIVWDLSIYKWQIINYGAWNEANQAKYIFYHIDLFPWWYIFHVAAYSWKNVMNLKSDIFEVYLIYKATLSI